MEVRCPHCHSPVELASDSPLSAIACPACGSTFSLLGEDDTAPYEDGGTKTIGHFELLEQMGAGRFGTVWRARDTELDRTVAVKIPRGFVQLRPRKKSGSGGECGHERRCRASLC
jgi:hypothetical protein